MQRNANAQRLAVNRDLWRFFFVLLLYLTDFRLVWTNVFVFIRVLSGVCSSEGGLLEEEEEQVVVEVEQ